MHVHPDIAALRSDRLAQRRVQARMREASVAWRGKTEVEELATEIDRYGEAAPLGDCSRLCATITEQATGRSLAQAWIGAFLEALETEPLGEVPHVYRCADGFTSVQLLRSGAASLNLVAYERRAARPATGPASVLFSDRECHELVLAGAARGTIHRRRVVATGATEIETIETDWSEGDCIALSGSGTARQIAAVDDVLLLLQLVRSPERPAPSREFSLADGTLLATTSGDKRASQKVMALAVLGAMGEATALSAIEQRALDACEDCDVRWEAARQALALDPVRGMRLLWTIRSNGDEGLARAASSLERQLVASYPQLARHRKEAA
ncbi:hypothetical protein ACI5KX_11555 [Erythrobacter sp. GH1-10]|uniref:hypothetical protein n=1 Tax=Erythrobacter sp. GH1-10 TaxID=3349334 RepID=UPI003878179B